MIGRTYPESEGSDDFPVPTHNRAYMLQMAGAVFTQGNISKDEFRKAQELALKENRGIILTANGYRGDIREFVIHLPEIAGVVVKRPVRLQKRGGDQSYLTE